MWKCKRDPSAFVAIITFFVTPGASIGLHLWYTSKAKEFSKYMEVRNNSYKLQLEDYEVHVKGKFAYLMVVVGILLSMFSLQM